MSVRRATQKSQKDKHCPFLFSLSFPRCLRLAKWRWFRPDNEHNVSETHIIALRPHQQTPLCELSSSSTSSCIYNSNKNHHAWNPFDPRDTDMERFYSFKVNKNKHKIQNQTRSNKGAADDGQEPCLEGDIIQRFLYGL